MDKVKVVLDILKKHHFWAVIGVVAVLGLMIYMSAAADLSDRTTKRVKTLKSGSTQLNGLAGRTDHPNEKKIEKWIDLKKQQEQEVREAWQSLYDEQRKANRWPVQLGEKFRRKVEEELGPKDEIPTNYCNDYWYAIEKAIPELLETIDYQRYVPVESDGEKPDKPKAAGPGGRRGRLSGLGGGPRQQDGKWVGTIVWNNWEQIINEFTWSVRPSSLKVRLAQEDYWVYKALLTIISKTNGEVKTRSDATVKEITELLIGAKAAGFITSNPVQIVSTTGTGATGTSGMHPEALGEGSYKPGPSATGSTSTPEDMDNMLLEQRYVDGKLTPLTAEQTKNSPPYQEFKMMPIVMKLIVDQRKIPELLVECANSTMPVKVVQLRINPDKSQSDLSGRRTGSGMRSGPGGPGGGYYGGPDDGLGGESPMGPGGSRPSSRRGPIGSGDEEASPFEVTVEIRGVISIYNPPPEKTADATGNESSE